ncbi:MAG: hypothetical protein VR64_18730 [Desulfatitalea sp. BRH_c12]|nr:MAG: hypothetical protein VR64_18730 [Desulfatitalea sp. BRH_c12]
MTKAHIDRRTWLGWALALIAISLLGVWSCGKKAPPVPPKRPPLPRAADLKGQLVDDTVTLTWQRGTSAEGITAYVIMRAQADVSKPPCPGCPLVFQKVGSVDVDRDTETVVFSDPVPPGFVYTYKVQPVGSSGDRGPDSNAVIIDRSSR